jgi:hypothetical protein
VEESRTNLVTNSNTNVEFSNGAAPNTWTSGQSAPDGSSTAKLCTTSNRSFIEYIANSVNNVSSTFSIYLKTTGSTITRTLGLKDAASDTIRATKEITITPNWQRFDITGTVQTNGVRVEITSNALDIFAWGAQLEAGSFPTSYIPTEGSQVTRAEDVPSISGANFSSWYRQDEGTVFADSERPDASRPNTVVASITDGTAANRIEVRSSSATNDNARCEITTLGSGQFGNPALSSNTAYKKIALAYAVNNVNAAANGNVGTIDTAASIPVVSQLYFGNDVFLTNYRPGHIKRLTYWPTRLSDATLQAITQ